MVGSHFSDDLLGDFVALGRGDARFASLIILDRGHGVQDRFSFLVQLYWNLMIPHCLGCARHCMASTYSRLHPPFSILAVSLARSISIP